MSSIKNLFSNPFFIFFSQRKGRQFSSGEQVTSEQDKRKDKKTRCDILMILTLTLTMLISTISRKYFNVDEQTKQKYLQYSCTEKYL